MCWAFRYAKTNLNVTNGALLAAAAGTITASGRDAVMIVRKGAGLEAVQTRYGMSLVSPLGKRSLFWNARDDKLNEAESWSRLVRQRCIVPVDAYCETQPAERWMAGATGYMIGLYDPKQGGGMVLVTEADPAYGEGARRPVVLSEADARTWLTVGDWDAYQCFQDKGRKAYDEIELFESTRMSTDARRPARAA